MSSESHRVEVNLGPRSYTVFIEPGLLSNAGERLVAYARTRRLITVTDPNVWALHGETFASGLAKAGISCFPILVPQGEQSKSWHQLALLIDRLVELGVERGETLVALGGGVIGDLTGFAAAILKRGCPYVQIPTTLVAQIDSSVGGKTAINIAGGKNLVGLFHQPSAVLIDPECLSTLPIRQLRAGYAELVKYALIDDPWFFNWCEENGQAIFSAATQRGFAVAYCIEAKTRIVARDESEANGERALLNFGHTFGHALEAEARYSDELLHGEAVALGMALAFRFAVEQNLCPTDDAERVIQHLVSIGLPTELGELGLATSGKSLVERIRYDKKASDRRVPFILTRGIGKAFVDTSVELHEIAAFLDRQLARKPVVANAPGSSVR